MATFYRIIPETRIVIFLIFLYYFIQIWWIKNEQGKTFRKLEKPSIIFLMILMIYQYNVSNLIYNHFTPPYHWLLIIITINIVYFRKIIKLIKQENCPKLLKYICILFIIFLLSTVKPYIY